MKPAAVFLALLLAPLTTIHAAERVTEVCAYGGTASGLLSAIAAAKAGKKVLVVEPSRWLGGMIGGGIRVGRDCAYPEDIGGLTKMMLREDAHLGVAHDHHGQAKLRDVWRRLVEEHGIEVLYEYRLKSVKKEGARVVGIELEKAPPQPDGCPAPDAVTGEDISVTAKVFIDASYEGDLMAKAGVKFTVGREPESQYGESLAGIRRGDRKPRSHYTQGDEDHFKTAVDPFVVKGDPASGLLPWVKRLDLATLVNGTGDAGVQAYNYRLCVTDDPTNRVPFEKPEGYRELDHELLLRVFESGDVRLPILIEKLPNRKYDWNSKHAVGTDLPGASWPYPEANHAERQRIAAEHALYAKGCMWTLANHPRVPESIRRVVSKHGWCRDEFVATGGFPPQLYVREGRRMLADAVVTQGVCMGTEPCPDPVALGSFGLDSHAVQYFVNEQGHVHREGVFWLVPPKPYGISWRAIRPKREECLNLVVPSCISASHAAYGSLRMEPVYMALGQAAGTAAVQAIRAGGAVQDVPYEKLRERLLADGARL